MTFVRILNTVADSAAACKVCEILGPSQFLTVVFSSLSYKKGCGQLNLGSCGSFKESADPQASLGFGSAQLRISYWPT